MTAPAVAVPRFLRIELRTPTVLGAPSADPLDVDLDITADSDGLPYIPRHRLSARLRDAALEASWAYPSILPTALELLGSSRGVGPRRCLQIGHARLPVAVRAVAARALHSESAGTGAHLPRPLASRIRDACTDILTSTTRDDDGAPVAGTLRQIRAVRAGIDLTAPVIFTGPAVTTDHLRALSLMCMAFEQIGTGASRGLGQIRCSIDGDVQYTRTLAFGEDESA